MSKQFNRLGILLGSFVPMIVAISAPLGPGQKPSEGAAYYAKNCAPCHGAKGDGGAAYPRPLVGTRTVAELGKFISQSMPPGPKKTPIAQANLVAEYIHGAFYSPLAQERNRPARISVARLTVRQFKNAVADLIGDSRPTVPQTSGGLKGEYFKNRDRSTKNRVLERVDPQVDFNFGTVGPAEGSVEPHNYSITWRGSLLAPDSGDYELIIQTDHATRLTFNGGKRPFIDAWVKSGKDTEYRASATLLGGRAYPLTLEFSKATQGVNDDAKKKDVPPSSAFVRLLWKRPKGAMEPIPANYLYPTSTAPTYVVTAPFPPDDRSIGYERGNTVTKAWDDATTEAALSAADQVIENLAPILRAPGDSPDRVDKVKNYARSFVQRAFRQPLTKELEQTYIEKQFLATTNLEVAVKRVVLLTLKSPRFLYREIGNRKDPYSIASELSFGLWDSIPDAELLRAAGSGELATNQGIERQAKRLVDDPRAWNKLRDFLLLWLKVDEIPDLVKSRTRFPDFDAAVATDLRTSFDLFLENTAWGKDSDFRQLLLSPTSYWNGRLSKIYGGGLPLTAPFQAVASTDRVGVLTHPYLMSKFAYLEGSSPIHRGVLVARNMLGRMLAPPPQAFAPLPANLHPGLTTRERVALQTKPDFCNGCHSLINPLGYPFEEFDAIGRIRKEDNGKPIDTSGLYESRSGSKVEFADAADLAKYIAESDESHSAFVEKVFQHMIKQPVRAFGPKALPNLVDSFKKERLKIRSLLVSIMMTSVTEPVTEKQT